MQYPEDQFIFVGSWDEPPSKLHIPGEIVIVIPSINFELAQKAARVLLRKAGVRCCVLIFKDNQARGYISAVNFCFRNLRNPFFVFAAEDCFPGQSWLKLGYMEMINGGLGLVSFNDGKWAGKIASFGLVRRDWAEPLYSGDLFFNGYKKHAADNELTAIARFQGRYKYCAQSTLLEVDYQKPWTNKTDPIDWALFTSRLREGFSGKLTPEGVSAELALYDKTSQIANAEGETERIQGRFNKHEVLALVHEVVQPKFYFEIGVQHGYSLALAKCPALGVDPAPVLKVNLPSATKVVRLSSDDFFAFGLNSSYPEPGLVFIDGMHLSEYVLRDLINVVRWANRKLVVVIDDIFPNNNAQGQRTRSTRHWAGDVWKIARLIVRNCPNTPKLFIDVSPTGLLLIVVGPDDLGLLLHSCESIMPSLTDEVAVDIEYVRRSFPNIEVLGQSPLIRLREAVEKLLTNSTAVVA